MALTMAADVKKGRVDANCWSMGWCRLGGIAWAISSEIL